MEFLRSAIPITNIRCKNIERQPVLDFKNNVCTACGAESEPPGAATFTAAPSGTGADFSAGRSKKGGSGCIFQASKKEKTCTNNNNN